MTETQPTTEQPTYGGDVSGLEKAAREVTANREAGPEAAPAEIDVGETAPAVGPGNMADRHDPRERRRYHQFPCWRPRA